MHITCSSSIAFYRHKTQTGRVFVVVHPPFHIGKDIAEGNIREYTYGYSYIVAELPMEKPQLLHYMSLKHCSTLSKKIIKVLLLCSASRKGADNAALIKMPEEFGENLTSRYRNLFLDKTK